MLFFNLKNKNKINDKIKSKSKQITNDICTSISELNIIKDIIELKIKELLTNISNTSNKKDDINKIVEYYNKSVKSYMEDLIDSDCYIGDIFTENRKWFIEIRTDSKSLKQIRIW